jgi:glutamyl aminopeptidase
MSRVDRSRLLDDDDFGPAAPSSNAGRRGNFAESAGDASQPGALATVKSWWEDPRKRRWIIGGSIGVVTFIIIVAIAAFITRDKREGGGSEVAVVSSSSSSSSTGAAPPPPPPPDGSSSTGSDVPYNPETPWLFPRLPNTTVPTHYDVLETIDLAGSVFWGTVNISLRITRPSDHIVLHALDLQCSDVSLRLDDGRYIAPAAVWTFAQNLAYGNQYLVLNFSAYLQPQQAATLNIAFRGSLVYGSGVGLYPSAYFAQGRRHLMASTQFEAADARRAFPCFDEPALKATFSMTVINAPQYPTVLSNMPGTTTTLPSGWLQTTFDQTPPMSTYLVAIAVSDFVYRTEMAQCGPQTIESRVFAPPHLLNWTSIPAKIAAQQISFYCSYFNSPYPLPKEDHFPVWNFNAGAMENWGLITYQWGILLLDPESYDVQQLEDCATVIAHELAHQWFGNIVTAAWWSQLWLNEGFATFVEYIGAERSNPELRLQDQFITIAQANALDFDADEYAQPVEDYNTVTGNFNNADYVSEQRSYRTSTM